MCKLRVVLSVVLLSLWACGDDDEESNACDSALETVKLGVVLPLTGNVQIGDLWQRGAQLALDDVNAAGGVQGHCIETEIQDSQSDTARAVQLARDFLEAGDVSGLLFQLSSDVAALLAPPNGLYYDDADFERLPILCTGCTAPDFDGFTIADFTDIDGDAPLWRMTENNAAQGVAMAELVANDSITSAASYVIDLPFGTAYGAQFESTFTAGGGTITDSITHPDDLNPATNTADAQLIRADLETIYSDFDTTGEPAALMVNSLPEVNVAVIEEWEAIGAPGTLFMSFTAVTAGVFDAAQVATATKDQVKGVSYAVGAGTDGDEFRADFRELAGQATPAFGDAYYDAVMLFSLAAAASGSTQPSGLEIQQGLKRTGVDGAPRVGYDGFAAAVAAFENGDDINYDGVSGPLNHDLSSNNAVNSPLTAWRVENGEIIFEPLP